jgi:hypothetical protein
MRQIENENPIIKDLLEQGYYIEEIRDIIIHIHEEIRRGKDIEEIFDRYSLSLDLLNDLNTL